MDEVIKGYLKQISLKRTPLCTLVLLIMFTGLSSCKVKTVKDGPEMATVTADTAVFEAGLPIVKLTNGPKQHWFGYYDKWQVDPTGRYILGCQVDTFFRSPKITDTLRIGVIDLLKNNEWTELGISRAWGWQQGCMLQWLPGSDQEIIWNDLEGGKFVSRLLNLKTGAKRTLPKPVYTLSNDGSFALGTAFGRIQNMRPGYGYPGTIDPYANLKAPEEIGIYKMDMQTGKDQMLVSIKEMADIPNLGEDLSNYWHYFNHLLISPDDQRFTFLHRWRNAPAKRDTIASIGFITRMVTASIDGSNRYILDPSGHTSHFIWREPNQLCMWTKPSGKEDGFYLFTDKTDQIESVGENTMVANGHNTYVPNTNFEWILNDTYPQGDERLQELYLYHVPTGRKVSLGKFHEPEAYSGEWRCDLHPRSSQDGKFVIFDSSHGGDGRQMYMVDISGIVGN
jgi:3D (Asp-Asp-Asp) domain-containing protein